MGLGARPGAARPADHSSLCDTGRESGRGEARDQGHPDPGAQYRGLVKLPHLSLAQIYDAPSFYYDHQADVDADIEANREAYVRGTLDR